METIQMTDNLSDFNDLSHRLSSATAAFQKGIYHLFFLSTMDSQEHFSKILRTYQCLFQLCLTYLLLDSSYKLDAKHLPSRLRKLCDDAEAPTRAEIDPAAIVTHSVFENRKWKGLGKSHPLHLSSKGALDLYQRTVEARHNLLYRPFMLANYWEDCTLINLLDSVPSSQEVEAAYKKFLQQMLEWSKVEQEEMPERIEAVTKALRGEPHNEVNPICAGNFLYDLFKPYQDMYGVRPTESLLLTYARMLNPKDEVLLRSIVIYRNSLIESQNLMKLVRLQSDWRTPEFSLQ